MSYQFRPNVDYPGVIDVFTYSDEQFPKGICCGYIRFEQSQGGHGFLPEDNETFIFGPEMLKKIIDKIAELDNEKI